MAQFQLDIALGRALASADLDGPPTDVVRGNRAMSAGGLSASEERVLPLRVGLHGPLGSGKSQGAVPFLRNHIGTEARDRGSGVGRRLSVRGMGPKSGGRPRPLGTVGSHPRGRLTKGTLDQSDFIFDTADGVLAVDGEQRIVLWNEGAEALLGFKAQEVLGRYCHEVLGGQDDSGCVVCQANCPDMMGALRRERVRTRDLLVRTKAGRETWINMNTIRVPSRRKELCLLVHLFRDASRQKELERFVEQLRSNVAKLSLSRGTDPPIPPAACPPVDLTRREREVLRLLTSGASTQAIAKKLFISHATARHHIHHVLAKLRVHSRLEAVTLALRNGMI